MTVTNRKAREIAMLHIGTKMFMQIPDNSGQRILYPATVVEVVDGIITAEFDTPIVAIEAEQEVFVYHDMYQEFMKQSAVVDEHIETETQSVIRFHTTSEPVSAENRQCYRVSTIIADLVARLGPEEACPLLDVSATGFALFAKHKYNIGNHVEVTLYYEDEEYSGLGCVQSVRTLSKERFRYGFLAVDDKHSQGNLLKGLKVINASAQREQLQRLSGIA